MAQKTLQNHPRQLKQPILVFAPARIGCFSCRRHSAQRSRQSPSPTLHSPLPTLHSRQRLPRRAAFTLLEVVLAVTIAGALLAAAAALMVSVTTVWMERQDRHFFEDHVDGVTEFVQACFSSAGTEIALGENSESGEPLAGDPEDTDSDPPLGEVTGDIIEPEEDSSTENENSERTGGGLVRVSEEPVGWGKPPGYAEYQDPLLSFGLMETPPLLIQTDGAPAIGIQAFLHFERDEGLSLLWFSPLQEASEDINDLRRTPISDLVSKVEYIYWDERFEGWETETEPREGEGDEQFLLPRFLKLTFEYEGETKERTLTIPVPSQSALIF